MTVVTIQGIAMSTHPLSDEHREAFWRRAGWDPLLPDAEREAIERRWDDESIDLAEIFGF
ncbi:hypothetical protein [Nocardia seriolae]|uniref:Uncharacterized protein n=2 Tax=Nocardia seriolae TaxID=37332 RepID=A0ABC9YNR9_9NOCA|nr:hypothetical protein [Nocardia seriolae]GEM22885.1 hypothetical protein NS2_11240 [Nocardia seriolae NBRC 15557]OJF77929.1 hypothetical protein NS14008_00270 [Nocardia seriolae]PSK32315.1 hypothetical protein C6575_06030 [Nocardia seriolae]QOW37799.1 hypothetical protein IMZ23_28080 [Nocardia seriolae]QUN22028.1 hypothetical protein KEC46_09155 [Nocardia seriolae]